MSQDDTIAAVATAPGEAGIAVVRVSGPQSFSIADRVFQGGGSPPSARPHGSFVHGFVSTIDRNGEAGVVDEVVLLLYRAPHSYTREDVVEFQGHGGRVSSARVLQALLEAGARLAEPGEFTRRAFLNGRIDLLQAEAVLDLIRAQSDRAASAAMEQLEGRLSSTFTAIYDTLLGIASDLEASLDFPEEDIPDELISNVPARLSAARDQASKLMSTWHEGKILREGAVVVICGQPNVGKSSLMNSLIGSGRSIVTEHPGTTRDTIEESLILSGYPIRLIDTAGMRTSDCPVEKEGVNRAKASIGIADIILFVTDASKPQTAEEDEMVCGLDSRKVIVVLNKIDLCREPRRSIPAPIDYVLTSIKTGDGLEDLRAAIKSKLEIVEKAPAMATISERHRQALVAVLSDVEGAILDISHDPLFGIAPCISSVRSALERIGLIIGRTYSNDILDHIFSRFCLGK